MAKFGGDPKEVDFLKYDLTNIAYAIRHQGRSAVIGVGGDGRGVAAGASQGRGFGILGMRERAHKLGGELSISTPATGTTVTVRLPLKARQARRGGKGAA